MTWTSDRIRQTFLEFYAGHGHRRMSSLSLVPPGDPTLLFTNAGMVQFKDVFTGKRRVEYGSATTSQKCLRVSGKHNDLENVGRTARHHTFFEMLGNFSFGSYFKEGAIATAWELLTKVYGLPVDALHVTVHPDDGEARLMWERISGLPQSRILNDPDNFWAMGDTGPCGPCSEIYVTLSKLLGRAPPEGQGVEDTLEIWNLVFMQYERDEAGHLTPLPRPCIDTGMGLERITAVMQRAWSNYDTDLFQPLIQHTAKMAGVRYGEAEETDVALRVIADHSRAAAFLVADGIYPENEGRGYVIRRVMRRAMRFGRKLGLHTFLADACGQVVNAMGEAYPELVDKRQVIETVVRQEEERFGRTLEAGLKRLEEAFVENAASRMVPGVIAFELYDTHGFPLDLTEQAAAERGFGVDHEGFSQAMEAQRAKGRASWKGGFTDVATWEAVRDQAGTSRFVGYEREEAEGKVLAVAPDGAWVVTDVTPFYAESGGQVGDKGVIRGPGGAEFEVQDTLHPLDGVIVHHGRLLTGRLEPGAQVTLAVNGADRASTRRNHSATHLLHFALRRRLGDHVKQRGSLVGPHRLRFDFSHFAPLTADEVRDIERLVNERVVANAPARTDVLAKEEAVARGAIAFFGDKYGETVRMLTLGADSVELCGGTHVRATGDIGLFKIVGEQSIASGVRRIEALTGLDALAYVHDEEARLAEVASSLKASPAEAAERVQRLRDEKEALQRELEALRARGRTAGLAEATPEVLGGLQALVMSLTDVSGNDLRDLSDKARERIGSGVVLLASSNGPKVALLVAVTKDLEKRLHAGKIVGEIAPIVGGRGGGRPDLAQAGGDQPERLDDAIARFKQIVAAQGARGE